MGSPWWGWASRGGRGGVVGGTYFEVMGLHPVLGRLLDAHDDGPKRPALWC